MEYPRILTRALEISWRHKYLWLLALFAGEATTIGFSFQGGSSGRSSFRNGDSGQQTWSHLTTWVSTHAALIWTAGITLTLLAVALFLLSAVANGALVKGSAEHDAERPFGLGQAWTAGIQTFWPVLRLKFFGLIVAATLVIVIGGLVVMTVVLGFTGAVGVAVATGLLAAVLVLLAIPLVIVLSVAIVLGIRAVVLEGREASDAFRAALKLIWRRRGRVALFWLLVGIAGWVASAVVGIALVVVALPLVALTVGAYFASGWLLAIVTGLGLGSVWLILVLSFVGGVNAFTSTCWTVAYPRFDLQPELVVNIQPQPA